LGALLAGRTAPGVLLLLLLPVVVMLLTVIFGGMGQVQPQQVLIVRAWMGGQMTTWHFRR
jgi:hypothetical protein